MPRLVENLQIKKKDPKHKVYCHEEYAQDAYDKYCAYFEGRNHNPGAKGIVTKDLVAGQTCRAEIMYVDGDKIAAQTESTQIVYLDLLKESRFLERRSVSSELLKPGQTVDVMIEGMVRQGEYYSASMEAAFGLRLKSELLESMRNKTTAYKVKVKSINEGGFIVDLSGVDCFMPGSLAAANRILDFQTMLGREVYVMVENYLEPSNMFVVSAKRYIQHVLPIKIKDLDFTKQYSGSVTGTMAYGAFVEWDEIFTGLLHESETEVDIKSLKAGDPVSFWIKEIKEGGKDGKEIRVILTQKGATTENKIYQEFKDKWEGKVFGEARIKDTKPFGIFVEMENVTGMLSPREFKKTGAKAVPDEFLDVFVKQVDVPGKKIYLRSINENE